MKSNVSLCRMIAFFARCGIAAMPFALAAWMGFDFSSFSYGFMVRFIMVFWILAVLAVPIGHHSREQVTRTMISWWAVVTFLMRIAIAALVIAGAGWLELDYSPFFGFILEAAVMIMVVFVLAVPLPRPNKKARELIQL
jgi:hypothetical protein